MKELVIRKKVRVSNPKRFMVSIMSLLVLSVVMINVTFKPSAAELQSAAVKDEIYYKIYVVKPTDNLWIIANRYTNSGDDTELLIKAIKEVNNLKDSTIHEGLKLRIPLKY